jgi:hypothetical protein
MWAYFPLILSVFSPSPVLTGSTACTSSGFSLLNAAQDNKTPAPRAAWEASPSRRVIPLRSHHYKPFLMPV